MSPWVYLLGGIGTLVAAIGTTVAVLRKLPAESRKISVDTMDVNVNIAGRLRDKAVADWERMGTELDDLRKDFDAYRKQTEDRMQAADVRLAAAEAATRKANERADRAEDALAVAREKIRNLSVMVNALRREMAANNIPVPDHLADDLEP